MRYEKYYVGKTSEHKGLFEQLRGKESAPNRVPDGNINMVNETSRNNGITKKASSNHVFQAPAITVSVNYAQTVFLQDEDFCASVNILILKNDWLTQIPKAGLYVVACLIKNNQKYDYSCKISKDRLNDTYITLPTLDELDENSPYSDEGFIPDWNYMQKRIEELEKERIEELEKYLLATGLNDYQLTDEDIDVLSLVSNGANKEFREFLTSKLFDIHPTKAYKMSNSDLYKTKGNTPVLSNSSTNNGVGGYSGLKPTEDGNIITFSDTTTGTDTMFHQSRDFIGYPHVQGMYPYDKEHWDEKKCLYFIGAMKAACGDGWSYSNKFTRKFVSNTTPLLPIQTDKDNNPLIDTERKYHPDGYIPDWDFMEKYIRAIEKVVIADVVKYKDEVIAKTKTTVG